MKKILPTLLLLLTSMIWGFAFVAQVEGSAHIDAFTFNGVRFLLGAISLLPVVAIAEGRRIAARGKIPIDTAKKPASLKTTVLAGMLVGSVLFTASTLQQKGAQITQSAGVSGFITGLYTVLTPIMCFFIFRKSVSISSWIGAVGAVGGLFLLCVKMDGNLSFGLGETLLLICSVFFATHIIVVDLFVDRVYPLLFSQIQFLTCGVLSMLGALIFEKISLESIINARGAILYCGIMSVGVAYTLQIISQKMTTPTYAAIIFSTESVFSVLGGVLFGTDSISPIGYVGCLIIFICILISQLNIETLIRRRKSPENINKEV